MPLRVHCFPPLLVPCPAMCLCLSRSGAWGFLTAALHGHVQAAQHSPLSSEPFSSGLAALWCCAGSSVPSLLVSSNITIYSGVSKLTITNLGIARSRILQRGSHQVCTHLFQHVLYNSYSIPLFPSYAVRGTSERPRCWSKNRNGYPSNAWSPQPQQQHLRSERERNTDPHLLAAPCSLNAVKIVLPQEGCFAYVSPCCIVKMRGDVIVWQVVFYCELQTCSTDVSSSRKRKRCSLHLLMQKCK